MIKSNLPDYNGNDVFWRDFISLENNPYKLKSDMSSFNCLFIFPTRKDDLSKQYYPTPIGYMASLLRMNHGKAKISVEDIESYDPRNLSGYNLICFYPMVASFSRMTEFLEKIKRNNPDSKICLFNSDQHQHEMMLCVPKAADFAKRVMEKNPSVDYVLIGEAESSFISLCEKINNRDKNLNDIPSCLYRENGEIKVSGKPIEPVNFRFLPFQARDYLETTINKEGVNTASPRIQASRGCVSPCSYCVESSSNITEGGRKRPILLRDISELVNEIEMLHKDYGVVFFNSIDSSFEDPGKLGVKRMKQFCEEVQKKNIEASFKIHMRAESVDKLEDSFLKCLKYSGIDVIGTGVESGLEKELESYKKIASVQQNKRGVQRLIDNNFFIILGHMMFSPILELDDLAKKANFLKEIHYGWDFLSWSNNLVVYPETAYHRYIRERGLELEHDESATRVPYRYVDERVGKIAEVLGNLKLKFPETMLLHQLLYDSCNIVTRYHNRMNRHLWMNHKPFRKFKENLEEYLSETEKIYSSFFLDLINIVSSSRSLEENLLHEKHKISSSIQEIKIKAKGNIDNFILACEDNKLSTSKLYLRSWFSMRDSQNTTGGKNE